MFKNRHLEVKIKKDPIELPADAPTVSVDIDQLAVAAKEVICYATVAGISVMTAHYILKTLSTVAIITAKKL